MKRIITLLAALLLLVTCVSAETTNDAVFATVNGEALLFSDYYAIESAYMLQYESAGVDLTDNAVYAYLQDLAITHAVEQLLIKQDMRAQGCYDFTEEEETWFAETGKASYEAALADVKASLLASDPTLTDADLEVYALAYAMQLNVTEQTYVDFYRTQYAQASYYAWLTQDNPVTDADVQAAYERRVEASQALYGEDAAAFETALNNGQEAWYRPGGYRSIQQILLPAQGATADERLASVKAEMDDIYARLAAGEAFADLMKTYSTDDNTLSYQVHADSVIWNESFVSAAFSEDMAEPGCWSQPLVSELGVHILYYLADIPAGPMTLTPELSDALRYVIYTERHSSAQAARLEELSSTAEIIFH